MKPSTHTPGPWRYHLGRGARPRLHIQTTGGHQIASTIELAKNPVCFAKNEACEANARLIAAAPSLLTALAATEKELDNWHNWQLAVNPQYPKSDGCQTVRAVLVQAKAALDQAKGTP